MSNKQDSEATRNARVKRGTTNTICNYSILVLAIMLVVYMFDMNTGVATFVSGTWVAIYNGVGSLFDTQPIMQEVVRANVKMGFGVVAVISAGAAWFTNLQQR